MIAWLNFFRISERGPATVATWATFPKSARNLIEDFQSPNNRGWLFCIDIQSFFQLAVLEAYLKDLDVSMLPFGWATFATFATFSEQNRNIGAFVARVAIVARGVLGC